MPLTLEQLDQFGTLESMPQYSLDHDWYADKVCGNWTLDELNNFGNLDTIQISLDSAVWGTACIYLDAPAAVTASASVAASAIRERTG